MGGAAQHLLPHGHDRRQRIAGRAGRRPRKQERFAASRDPGAGERQGHDGLRLGPRRSEALGPGRRAARARPAQHTGHRPDRSQRRRGQSGHQPGQGLESAARLRRGRQPRASHRRAQLNLLVGVECLRPSRRLPVEAFSQAAQKPGCRRPRCRQRRRDLSCLSPNRRPPARRSPSTSAGSPAASNTSAWARATRAFSLKEGERFVFNSTNWNQPAMAVIQLDPKLKTDTAVTFVTSSRQHPRRLVHYAVLRGRAVPGLQLLAQRHAAPARQRRPGADP